jgi:hypothetical protein
MLVASRSIMLVRQRIGILFMILFLPINGPILRLVIQELINRPLPIGEFDFFVICVFLFLGGGIMTFTPKLKFAFHLIE